MKKLFLFLIVAMLLMSCADKASVVEGRINNYKGSQVSLMNAITMDGNLKPVKVNKDGTFRIEFDDDSARINYIIFSNPEAGCKIYTEPGSHATLTFTLGQKTVNGATQGTCQVDYQGDCKEEFEFLKKVSYFDAQNKVLGASRGNNWTFSRYQKELRKNVDALEAQFMKVGSDTFHELMKTDYEHRYLCSIFWYSEVGNAKDKDFVAFINSIDRDNNKEIAMMYAEVQKKIMPIKGDPTIAILNALPQMFKNKEMISAVASQQMESAMTNAPKNIDDIYAAYKRIMGNSPIPASISSEYDKARKLAKDKQAPDFTMTDAKGNVHHLSEFEGKAVYIDVWATWCGPCKAQIPNMAKLYEKVKNRSDIVLISVSVDQDRDAWLKKINNDNPAWPQFLASDAMNGDLCKNYGIQAIPRFIMINRDGKLVDAQAPMPSEQNILNYILKNLKSATINRH